MIRYAATAAVAACLTGVLIAVLLALGVTVRIGHTHTVAPVHNQDSYFGGDPGNPYFGAP